MPSYRNLPPISGPVLKHPTSDTSEVITLATSCADTVEEESAVSIVDNRKTVAV